jgi:hypothetical protein
MAPVELDFYREIEEVEEDCDEDPLEFLGDKTVEPGSHETVDDFNPANLIVFCDREDRKGSFQATDETSHLEVTLYKNDDDEGEVLDPNQLINFSGSEVIRVESELHDKVIFVYHDRSLEQREKPALRRRKKSLVKV